MSITSKLLAVEKLLGRRPDLKRKDWEYLVQWKDYPGEDTWEPSRNIFDKSLIEDYHRRRRSQRILDGLSPDEFDKEEKAEIANMEAAWSDIEKKRLLNKRQSQKSHKEQRKMEENKVSQGEIIALQAAHIIEKMKQQQVKNKESKLSTASVSNESVGQTSTHSQHQSLNSIITNGTSSIHHPVLSESANESNIVERYSNSSPIQDAISLKPAPTRNMKQQQRSMVNSKFTTTSTIPDRTTIDTNTISSSANDSAQIEELKCEVIFEIAANKQSYVSNQTLDEESKYAEDRDPLGVLQFHSSALSLSADASKSLTSPSSLSPLLSVESDVHAARLRSLEVVRERKKFDEEDDRSFYLRFLNNQHSPYLRKLSTTPLTLNNEVAAVPYAISVPSVATSSSSSARSSTLSIYPVRPSLPRLSFSSISHIAAPGSSSIKRVTQTLDMQEAVDIDGKRKQAQMDERKKKRVQSKMKSEYQVTEILDIRPWQIGKRREKEFEKEDKEDSFQNKKSSTRWSTAEKEEMIEEERQNQSEEKSKERNLINSIRKEKPSSTDPLDDSKIELLDYLPYTEMPQYEKIHSNNYRIPTEETKKTSTYLRKKVQSNVPSESIISSIPKKKGKQVKKSQKDDVSSVTKNRNSSKSSQQVQSSDDEEEEQDFDDASIYEVEKIVGKRRDPLTGQFEWSIRWKGYRPDEDTWQIKADINSAPLAMKEFEDKLRRQLMITQSSIPKDGTPVFLDDERNPEEKEEEEEEYLEELNKDKKKHKLSKNIIKGKEKQDREKETKEKPKDKEYEEYEELQINKKRKFNDGNIDKLSNEKDNPKRKLNGTEKSVKVLFSTSAEQVKSSSLPIQDNAKPVNKQLSKKLKNTNFNNPKSTGFTNINKVRISPSPRQDPSPDPMNDDLNSLPLSSPPGFLSMTDTEELKKKLRPKIIEPNKSTFLASATSTIGVAERINGQIRKSGIKLVGTRTKKVLMLGDNALYLGSILYRLRQTIPVVQPPSTSTVSEWWKILSRSYSSIDIVADLDECALITNGTLNPVLSSMMKTPDVKVKIETDIDKLASSYAGQVFNIILISVSVFDEPGAETDVVSNLPIIFNSIEILLAVNGEINFIINKPITDSYNLSTICESCGFQTIRKYEIFGIERSDDLTNDPSNQNYANEEAMIKKWKLYLEGGTYVFKRIKDIEAEKERLDKLKKAPGEKKELQLN